MAILRACSLHIYRSYLIVLVFALVPLTMSAQGLVLHRYASEEPDQSFEELLYLASGVALIQQGLSSARQADKADYLLLVRYDLRSGQAELSYRLHRGDELGTELSEGSLVAAVDTTLDAAIAKTLERLLLSAGLDLGPSAEAKIYGLMDDAAGPMPQAPPVADPEAGPQAAAPPVLAGSAGAESGTGTESGTAAALPQAGTVVTPDENQQQESHLSEAKAAPPVLSAWTSLAGLMFVGDVMDYLRSGLGGRLGLGLVWKNPARSLGLDARLAFSRAFNNTGVVGGPLLLGSGALGFSLGSGTSKAYTLGAGIAGGAAVLLVDGDSGTLAKTVPYMELETFFGVPLGRRLSLGAALRFLAAFDRDLVIMGISPALSLGMEF